MADSGDGEVGAEGLLSALADVVLVKRRPDTGDIAAAGEGFEELTGYESSSIDELSWRGDIVHAADRERHRRLVDPADDADTFDEEYRIETRDGDTRWVRERGRTAETDAGESVIEGLVADVTAQKEQLAAHEPYRQLVENVGDPMYVLDADGYIQLLNEELAVFLGVDKQGVVGQHTTEILSDTVVERAKEIIAHLISSSTTEQTVTWEVEMEDAAGKTRPVQIRTGLIEDEDGAYAGSAGVIRDISEQKERERELERYETVIQAVGDPVYTLDAAGRFSFVNDAFERRFGYEAAEIVGQHASIVLDDQIIERSEQHIQGLLADPDEQSAKFEIQPETKGGERIQCELQMALLPYEESFRGTAGVVRDITERKQREQRLEQFTSVVSHDLRGPLSSLAARTELARETGDQEHFEEMERSIDRMDRLIDDLLTLARHGAVLGETRTVSLESVASRAWSSLETGESELEVVSEYQFDADAERLQQLLENLFRNSVEHSSDDGTGSVQVRVGSLDDREGFYVADDGEGIDPEKREQIFEHGYTTNKGGTGFGLSIVERIVTAHDWQIAVTDSWAGGARFEITTA